MKKATFFFMIMLVILLSSIERVNAEEFPFAGFTISLEEKVMEEEQKIIVTKGGIDSFETVLDHDGYDLHYNGVSMFGDYIVVYGYAMGGFDMRDYSGFFFVLDEAGSILFGEEDVFDYGFREDVKNIYTYDHHLMVELQQTNDNDYQVEVMKHIYLLYDETLNLIAEHTIEGLVHDVNVDEDLLFGRTSSGEVFDFGISSDGDLIWKDDYIGVEDSAVYDNEVCLTFLNDIVLNDEIYRNNTCVDTIGTHYLRYNDEMITFDIEPVIEGVEDGQIYYESVMISYTGGYALLNGDNYSNHQEIIDIGHYQFVIEGINGYVKELNFEIGSVVEGITNNTVYDEAVTISFTGQGYLNNQFITSPMTVEHDGEYILKIKGNDGYLESYYFEITGDEEETNFMDFVQKVDVFVLGTILIIGIVVVKKKR
ncbi:MAG: hypothetical protein ACVCEJ_08905 [Candidatus Izemoplasmataceae bacterium]